MRREELELKGTYTLSDRWTNKRRERIQTKDNNKNSLDKDPAYSNEDKTE